MSYKILEAKFKFNHNGTVAKALALVEISEGDIRAIEASDKYWAGYLQISPRTDHNLYELLQEVAGYGMEITRDKIPTEWINKYFRK